MALKLIRARGTVDGPWYIRGSIGGRRIEESTGTSNRKKAEEAKARRETELLDEKIHGRAAVATFAHACASYLQNGGEARFIKPLLDHLKTTKLNKINQAMVEDMARQLYPGAATSTITRQVITPIRAVMRHAAVRDMVEFKTFQAPKQPPAKTRWLSAEEATALLAACRRHVRPIVALMLYTGARLSEALYLDWREVDLENGQVFYLDTKTDKPRGVPLHPVMLDLFRSSKNRKGPVFKTHKGQPYVHVDEGGGTIKNAFRAAVKRAGLGKIVVDENGKEKWVTDVTPHTCRHTWASWHYREHRDLRRLMELGGWSQLAMVQRYTHVNVTQHAESIAALPTLGVNWGTAKTESVETQQTQKVRVN